MSAPGDAGDGCIHRIVPGVDRSVAGRQRDIEEVDTAMNGFLIITEGLAAVPATIALYRLFAWLERWDYERHRED